MDGDISVEIKPGAADPLPSTTAKIRGEFLYVQEVKDVDANNGMAKISVTYGKSTMDTLMGNQVIPNSDVSSLEGKVAVLTVAADGKVDDYKMPYDLPASVQNADFSKFFVEFPKHNLRLGESWFRHSETSDGQEQAEFYAKHLTNSKYTLLSLENKNGFECAKVRFESSSSSYTTSNKEKLDLNGEVKGSIDGIIYYDLSSGYVVYSDMRTTLKNEIITQAKVNDSGTEVDVPIKTVLNTKIHSVAQLL